MIYSGGKGSGTKIEMENDFEMCIPFQLIQRVRTELNFMFVMKCT